MNRLFLAAGIMAVGCAAPLEAHAQSCPRGQIFRVSMGVCQPKSADNAQWTNERGGKAALKPSTAKPAVGDVVLFGSTFPTLLKPSAPKHVAKEPGRKPAITKKRVASKVPAAAPASAIAAVAAPPAVPPRESLAAPRSVELAPAASAEEPSRQVAVAAPDAPVAKQDAPVAPVTATPEPAPAPIKSVEMSPQPAAQSDQAHDVSPGVEEPAAETGRDQQIAERDEGRDAPPPESAPIPAAPAPVVESPDERMTTASIEPRKPVRTIPLYQSPEPTSAPPQADASLPDWGDEKKLVAALRENWKSKPVTRTFQRGDEVPADIELQPLPAPFASRAAGVNMHYLISNNDAVLVLPGMRVVVDVYNSATASLN